MGDIKDFDQRIEMLTDFEADFVSSLDKLHSKQSLLIHQEELKSMWPGIKKAYSKCLNLDLKEFKDSSGTSVDQIKCKYRVVYQLYVDCLSSINDRLVMMSSKAEEASTGHSFYVPPCDIEIFSGDYLKWPSFRDLFTAVYVNNSRLIKGKSFSFEQ